MARPGDKRAFNRWPNFSPEQRREFGRRGAANQKSEDRGFACQPGLAKEAGAKGSRSFWRKYRAMQRVIKKFSLERLVAEEIEAAKNAPASVE